MVRPILVALALLPLTGVPSLVRAGVAVSIGIHLPAPPALVPVPSTPVLYAPGTPANYFFYASQYWVFADGVWYASSGYDGPWVVVAPEYVPLPILAVPVRYYRVPPPAWRAWQRDVAPRWDARWGRRWAEHRQPRMARHAERREERSQERSQERR